MELYFYANKKTLTLEKLCNEFLLGFEKLVEFKCASDAINAAHTIEELCSREFCHPATNLNTTSDIMCNTLIFLTSSNCLGIKHCLKIQVPPKI